jgi:hypothetical protein
MRLHRDWLRLCADPRADEIISGWAAECDALAGSGGAAAVLERMNHLYTAGDWAGHDQVFAALLRRVGRPGVEGEVAWRLAVRAMLPKAAKMARTQVRAGADFDEVFSIVVSALFEVVRTFPLHRTPRNIYTGLALRTLTLAQKTLGQLAEHVSCAPEVIAQLADGQLPSGRPARPAPTAAGIPEDHIDRLGLLLHAAELHLLCEDDPLHIASDTARGEVLRLVVWAVDTQVLHPAEAQEIARYYASGAQRAGVTSRAMGADGARLRKARSRGVRRLRAADHNAYFRAVA